MTKKFKPRLIPEQDRRICGSICLCQLTVVFSIVSIVYLSVAIYVPSYKAFQSGFNSDPVICQAINMTNAKNCSWATCNEWCLTKTGGFCPQINATARRNGTDVIFDVCNNSRTSNTSCPQVRTQDLKRYNCNNGTECETLTGVFNCTLGHCYNMSDLYLCHHKADGIKIDAEKDNLKLNGFFECTNSKCTKIKRPFICDRYCPKITTEGFNVYIMVDDNLITSDCELAYGLNEANGSYPGKRISPPKRIWNETQGFLITNCMTVAKDGDKINATDCINGTLLHKEDIPNVFMNFTQFWKIYYNSNILVDPTEKFLPRQQTLTIQNSSRLFINLEGCVNTLRGECIEFATVYGRDGRNNTAQSRFPCYYKTNDSTMVVSRFDLAKTWRELLISVLVPTILFIISFATLCVITQSVKVGDDTKMRCTFCPGRKTDQEEEIIENELYISPSELQSPQTSNPPNDANSSEMVESSTHSMIISPSIEKNFSEPDVLDTEPYEEKEPEPERSKSMGFI